MYPHAERSVQYRYVDERALRGSRPWSAHIFSCFQLQRCGCSARGAAWFGAQGDTVSSRPPAANPAPPAHSSNSVDAAFCWSDTSPKHRVHGVSGHPIVTPDGNIQTPSELCRYRISRFGSTSPRESGAGVPTKGLVPFCLNCVKRENASSFFAPAVPMRSGKQGC